MKLKEILGIVSVVSIGVMWQAWLRWLGIDSPDMVALAFPTALATGALGALSGGLAGRKDTPGPQNILADPSDIFRLPGFGFLAGKKGTKEGGQFQTALQQLLGTAGAGGLGEDVLQSGLADISEGFNRAGQAGGRQAALGFGPQLLTPGVIEASKGRGAARFRTEFGERDLQAKTQQAGLLQGLMDFFGRLESARLSNPLGTSTPAIGGLSGALGGLSAGLGAGAGLGSIGSLFGGGGGGVNTPVAPGVT